MGTPIRAVIWNEFIHEQEHEAIRKIYPKGIHQVIAEALEKTGNFSVSTATLDQPEHGLSKELLENTQVLYWWGHIAHDKVQNEIVERVKQRVLEGMGLVVLHSGHYSKIFRSLMGTTCSLKWREAAEKERIWVIEPSHPIAQDLPVNEGGYFEIPHEEMYGERFEIPVPDELVFVSWFQGGEVFRSGCCWNRGAGRIFYFRPGHESYPTYYNTAVQKILVNAGYWAAERVKIQDRCPNSPALEPLPEPPAEFGQAGIVQNLEDIQ
ncbi:ThuA domain-containing protein [Gracilinema caldarium]|uniref:ThuA domain-containing protein n=1 Tax=Gracilinema caldarium TaxID=215591 RepID=UPI0026EEB83B|nr:ThuA domain-containing protein [Gracilinema caldarium]